MLRTEKAGIIHCGVGKCSFNMAHLVDNINHVIQEVKKSKPAAAKGAFLKRIYVSTTMGQAVLVDAQAFR